MWLSSIERFARSRNSHRRRRFGQGFSEPAIICLARSLDLCGDALDYQRQHEDVVRLGSILDGFIAVSIHLRA